MGTVGHGFTIISKTQLDEIQAEGIFARHCKTGLEVYHIHNDDAENLFAFAFMTPPDSSSGVAHIIEHSVLCGSKNYPLKDPFLILSKQSVKTFLNAMTFPDKTVYPAASIIEKDYFNLMSVYGDAVFFPLLTRETFEQEGHRLEIDATGKPYFSGVVLNEMRGVYADFDSAVWRQSSHLLHEDTVYSHDSGGYPPDIVELSYEDFCAFHKKYYHPVNCKVFLYGNIDTEKQLAFLQEHFLQFFDAAEKPAPLPPIVPYTAPRTYTVTAPSGEGKSIDKLTVTMNWLLSESKDIDRLMDVMFLEELLLGHDGAPLQKKLLDCPFAEDIYVGSGLHAELSNMSFTLGLVDIDENAVKQCEAYILSALETIAAEAIDPQLIKTGLNAIDFYNREIIRASGPFSLILMRRALRGWMHNCPPEDTLRYIPAFERLKQRIAENPSYIQEQVRTLLLDNPHRILVAVQPDPHFCEKIDETLSQKAEHAAQKLNDAERKKLTEPPQTQEDEAELQSLIPHLSKTEIPPPEPPIPEYLEYFGAVPAVFHEQPTNGVTYLDLAIPVDCLSADDYIYLTLYAAALNGMGTATESWDSLAAQFAYLTGGFSAVTFSAGKHYAGDSAVFFDHALKASDIVDRDWIRIRSKMLPEYIEPAINLIFSYLTAASFTDTKRLADIVIQAKNDFDSVPAYAGHTLSSLHAASLYSGSKQAENIWAGIPQLRFLRELYGQMNSSSSAIETLAERLTEIHQKLLKAGMLVKVCGTPEDIQTAKKALSPHLKHFAFPKRRANSFRTACNAAPYRLFAFPSSVQVGFAAQVIPISFPQLSYGATLVYAQWLETGMLWNTIRVNGGAYGTAASSDMLTSLFTLTTYRDPAPFTSLRAMKDIIAKSRTEVLSDTELEALITGTYSMLLYPSTPAQKSSAALSRLFYGVTNEVRLQTLESIISCSQKELKQVADCLYENISQGSAATVCSDAALKQPDAASFPELTVLPSI
ncbi:MAG: insulinase family protein [Treponema sp.]|uniref:insulinase family protein n=1 Tax=Treponema sp. TaxID=166 RepID=UPI003FA32380